MDQFVVDIGDDDAAAGDEVVLFGTGERGEPTAQDWADACGTISYEIVSRMGGRLTRRYVGVSAGSTSGTGSTGGTGSSGGPEPTGGTGHTTDKEVM
jgi:alanine racemase